MVINSTTFSEEGPILLNQLILPIPDLGDITLNYDDAVNFASGYRNTDLSGDYFIELTDIIDAHGNSMNFVHLRRP